MKQIAVFMSLILIFNLLLFVPVFAEQEEIAEPSVAAGYNHVLGLNQYGRVFSAGDNTYGQCDTFHWKGITQVCAGKTFSAGLTTDKTVIIAGVLSEETGILADELSDIKQISAGDEFLAALDENGNVHIVGSAGNIDTYSWENIEEIACGEKHVVALKDNSVIGSDYNNGEMSLGFEDILVEDIYADENLTVVKDCFGKLHHYGNGTYITGSSLEEGSKWLCSEWEDIKTLDIQQGSAMNAIVIAVNNSGKVITDGTNLEQTVGWSSTFLQKLHNMENVKSVTVIFYNNYNYAIVVKEDNGIECMTDNTNVISDNFMAEIKNFDLKIKPAEISYEGIKIVPSYRTVGILLPNGDVCTIGPTNLVDFANINDLQATVTSRDYFFGVNDNNIIFTNLPEEDKAYVNRWNGIVKTATATWNGSDKLITALRWDGRVYSTYNNDLIENLKNVVDIAGGSFYTVALTNENVVLIENNNSNLKNFDVSSWKNIKKVFSGYTHIVGITEEGNCIATGKNGSGECNVLGWQDIVDIACGNLFTVGVDSDGKCYYTGKDKTPFLEMKEEIESWTNVKRVFAANNYVVAQKKDGTFSCAHAIPENAPDKFIIEKQIENTYFKDNTFYTFKVEEDVATVEYYSDEDLEVYFSYFDEEGRPIGFEKKVLESVPSLTKEEFENEKSHLFTVSIGEPTADKMKFYMEQEADGDTVKIRHCSLEGQRIMLAFYDDEENMIDIKVKTLGEINSMTETSFSCATATKYKLFIRDGALPLYKAEGTLN